MSASEQEGFESAIAQAPCDWDLRLIYADFLEDHDQPEEAARQRAYRAAYEWMQNLAARSGGQNVNYGDDDESSVPFTAEDLIGAGRGYVDHQEVLVQYGDETLRDLFDDDAALAEYWRHWEVLTGGRAVPPPEDVECNEGRIGSPFGCSC